MHLMKPCCPTEVHQATKADKAAWSNLSILAHQWRDGDLIEMRNCHCGSTLEIQIDPTAKAIADLVSMDSRPALHFAMPVGDATALRDELEERYALSSEVAICWDCEERKRVKRLVVSETGEAALDMAAGLEQAAEASESEWNEYLTFGAESSLGRQMASDARSERAINAIEGER